MALTRALAAALLTSAGAISAAGAAQEELSANLMHPDWHPDGQLIVAEGGCAGSIDLYLINLEEGAVHFLWDDGKTEGYPRWFSDGKHIAFHKMNRPERKAEIFTATVSKDGEISELRQLTQGSFTIEPAPSPDGQHMAYTLPGDNGLDVAISRISDRLDTRVLKTTDPDNFPSWSPDGNKVLFYSRQADTAQIFSYDMTTGETEQLTRQSGPNFVGHFRPDGAAIAYSSERDGDREIYLLDLENGEDRRLTRRSGRDGYPKFSPDGKKSPTTAPTLTSRQRSESWTWEALISANSLAPMFPGTRAHHPSETSQIANPPKVRFARSFISYQNRVSAG